MARLKSRPLQRTTKRRLQDRDRVLREGLRTSSSKRLRLQSQAERSTSTSKKGKKKKGKSPQKEPEDAHLPPELRRAGLMAHMAIPKGKCFGPFSGKIVSKEKSPDKMHFFVSEVGDKKRKSHYFYAHKNEKDKCSWLSRLQSATSKQRQNIVAYNCPRGVCFEALKDIAAGDELMVLFDASFKGASHSGSAENTPTVSYVTDETGKQIAVVPLDKEVDQTKVYVTSTTEDRDHIDDDTDGEDENNDREIERDDSLEEEDVEMEDGDIYEEKDDESEDDDDDDDYDDDDDDDDDDGDSMCDSDSDFFPGSQMQLTRFTAVNTRSNHDGNYNFNSADATSQSHKKRKKTGRQKKIPSIKETTVVDADTGAETVKYYCAHCMEAFIDKDKALEHTAALECLSKEFQCSTCTLEFRNASLLLRHLCGGKPKCNICDEEYEDLTQLQDHKQTPPMDHLPKCAKCNLQFQDLETKDRHVQTQHGPSEKQAECPVCHKTYNKSYLKEHMISHSGSDALKCQECGKKFSSKSNLNKHRKKHAPNYVRAVNKPREKKFSCPEEECEKTFDSQHALKSHQRSHTGERPFHCEQCSWKFTQKTHLTRHIRSVHDKVPRSQQSEGRSNAPATCELCSKVYVNSRVLLVHVQSVHEGLRPYKCDYCDATYTQRGHLWRHKHASHFEKEEVQKKYTSDKFCCNFDGCEQVYDTQPELVEHVKVHVGTTDKTCMCNECGATFVSHQNLAKHSRRRHLEPMSSPHKTHRCEKCDKTFFTSYQLVVHFRCHTGEKPYKCDLCGKEFVQKSGLRKHIRCKRCPMVEGRSITNKSARKYACEQCDKMFPGPSDLKAHQRTHTGEKPYQCLVCQKGFSQPGNLTKHVRFVHNKEQRPKEKVREKKFFCSLCGKAFLCPSSLAMHCRTHSGDKPFACEECGQAFAQAGNLKKHVKRWHGDGSVLLRKRRKGKGQKSSNESTEAEVRSQQTATNESQATEASPSTLHEMPGTQSNGQHDDSTCDTDTAVTSALTNTQSTQISQDRQTTCTPLNTPSHLYGNTPLNTAVTTNSLNVQPASQRIPILFGFVAPMEPNTVPSSQAPGASRIPVEQNITMHRTNPGGPLNAPAIPPQSTNLGSLSAQELQQVVISRMLASENTEGAFLPPNVSGLPSNSSPRPPVLLPHVHSLLNPTGMNSAGEVTVWPFSANSGIFQQ